MSLLWTYFWIAVAVFVFFGAIAIFGYRVGSC